MSKFKVGDRVVVVKNNHKHQGDHIGKRGTISLVTDEQEYEVSVLMDSQPHMGPVTLNFDSSELELESVYDALSAPPADTELVVDVKIPEDFKVDLSKLLLFDEPKVALRDNDVVNHPSHYTSHPSGVECKDIIGHYPTFIGNAIKYLWRAGLKDGNPPIQDLRKAIKNIEFEIERLGGTV